MHRDIPEKISLNEENSSVTIHEPEEDYIVINSRNGKCKVDFHYTTGGSDSFPVQEDKGLSKGLHNVRKITFSKKSEDCDITCETGFMEETKNLEKEMKS